MALKQNQLIPAEVANQTAEYVSARWLFNLDAAKFPLESLSNPEIWKLCAERINPGDEVTCIANDQSYDVTFRCVARERASFVLMRPLRVWQPQKAEAVKTGEPYVSYVPAQGFVVFDKDGEAVSAHPSHDAADLALACHLGKEAA